MDGRICGFLICALTLGSTSQASGQVSQQARLPYMAEFKTTQANTLADGSTVTHETTEVVAVDSQGRRMTATTTVPPLTDQTPSTQIKVFDPVGHANISWVSPGRVATISAIPIPAGLQCSYGVMTAETVMVDLSGCGQHRRHKKAVATCGKVIPSEKSTTEDLGTETIQGIEARGRRTTTTSVRPIGTNQPPSSTFELWTAADPGFKGLVVREVSDNPPSSKMSKELMRFSQAEPDSSIFRVPAGYETVGREVAVAIDSCPNPE